MDFFKQILVPCKFGPTQIPSTKFRSTLDEGAFNSLPLLVIDQIFDEIPMNEHMKLRGVSKFWNDYILSSRILKLQANEENWKSVIAIKARKIYLDIRQSQSIISNPLNLDFFIAVKKLTVGGFYLQQLYNILSATKNLETLYLYNPYIVPPNEQLEWASKLLIPTENFEWLKKLKHFECDLWIDVDSFISDALQCTVFIRKLLQPCRIESIKIERVYIQTNELFPATCFNYGESYAPTDVGVFAQFIRSLLDDHKTTVKDLALQKRDGEMKIKLDYNPESEASQALRVKEILFQKIPPLRKLNQPANFLGILDVIKNQTSIKTLEIGKYDGVIDAFEYRDLLLYTIFPNNSTTLTKLEIYTHANNPGIDRIYWKGSMFSLLHSLRSLCLRSNQTVKLRILDQIEFLPPSLTVLKTSYCISFPFGICPRDKKSLEDFFPNLEKLHVESMPWFVFNDGATIVKAVDNNLISILTGFKNLKNWELQLPAPVVT